MPTVTPRPKRLLHHVKLTVYIQKRLWENIQRESEVRGITLGTLVEEAFEQRQASTVVEVIRPVVLYPLCGTIPPVREPARPAPGRHGDLHDLDKSRG